MLTWLDSLCMATEMKTLRYLDKLCNRSIAEDSNFAMKTQWNEEFSEDLPVHDPFYLRDLNAVVSKYQNSLQYHHIDNFLLTAMPSTVLDGGKWLLARNRCNQDSRRATSTSIPDRVAANMRRLQSLNSQLCNRCSALQLFTAGLSIRAAPAPHLAAHIRVRRTSGAHSPERTKALGVRQAGRAG